MVMTREYTDFRKTDENLTSAPLFVDGSLQAYNGDSVGRCLGLWSTTFSFTNRKTETKQGGRLCENV